jgi:hypothetical protein
MRIESGSHVAVLGGEDVAAELSATTTLRVCSDLREPPVDVVVVVADVLADLERVLAAAAAAMHPSGAVWVAFPKRVARETDASRPAIRRVALAAGMVDDRRIARGDRWLVRLVFREDVREATAYRADPPDA